MENVLVYSYAMSTAFVIRGGKPLSGTIDVYGSKNAALPILAATLLTQEKCRISNVPRVLDVMRILEMLTQMGANVKWRSVHTVEIENKEITPANLKNDVVKKMRASIMLVGPLLARFGCVKGVQYPGGCSIGPRPIDAHLHAFEDLGARVTRMRDSFSVELPADGKIAKVVILDEFSVTATENILMLLSGMRGLRQIKIAASEPHVQDLARFLARMGARVDGAGTSTITVRGAQKLRGASHRVIPDYLEAGTFLLMVLATGGDVRIRNAPAAHLDLVIKKLRAWNADIRVVRGKFLQVRRSASVRGSGKNAMVIDKVQSLPYPGIPTDLQAAFGVLATQTPGPTLIHEPLYPKRFEYLKELKKMGARVMIQDPHRAKIWGPTALRGSVIWGHDIRGGAALIIAGLAARGKTVVHGAEHVERGYEDLDGRLRALGADIRKV